MDHESECQRYQDQAERRLVEVGFTDDAHAQIISGLAAGETVVIKGQRSLKPGTKLKILDVWRVDRLEEVCMITF